MICLIDGETFFLFAKNTWIGDFSASCLNTNNDSGLYDNTNIKELAQGSSDSMSPTKKDKLHMMVCQVNGSEK